MRRLALIALVIIFVPAPAYAHGTMVNPISRAYTCYQENPESPRSDVCKAVVAAGGTQPLYDWNEVNIAAAAGNHRALIPDGKLCSAGRDKYRGLDLARADWPATTVSPGAYTFRFIGTAPHKGTFELYLTRDGFNPAQPLRWSDLESTPFLRVTDPSLVNGVYQLPGQLPAKTGRHLIYTIWQRSDSPEAFYTCSDVSFGGGSNPAPAPSSTTPTSPAPAPASPSPTASATWPSPPTSSPATTPSTCGHHAAIQGTGNAAHQSPDAAANQSTHAAAHQGTHAAANQSPDAAAHQSNAAAANQSGGLAATGGCGGVPGAVGNGAGNADLTGSLPQTGGTGWRWLTFGGLLLLAGVTLAWFARERWLGKHRAIS